MKVSMSAKAGQIEAYNCSSPKMCLGLQCHAPQAIASTKCWQRLLRFRIASLDSVVLSLFDCASSGKSLEVSQSVANSDGLFLIMRDCNGNKLWLRKRKPGQGRLGSTDDECCEERLFGFKLYSAV